MKIKDDIRAEAKVLGFSLVGFCQPSTPPHFAQYQAWVEDGWMAGMNYLANEKSIRLRANPTLLMPGALTILVLAMPYWKPESIPLPGQGYGRIAAYAWGADYHSVIPPRLEKLAGKIKQITAKNLAWKGFSDAAPILEKDFTQSAGIGWIGKNTCLIAPTRGSYVLLAELLLDARIEPDEPFVYDRCGSCRRCIEACPTHCIRNDRTLEAGNCISYLTIENKGDIPRHLRPMMGSWIFGCDICQQLCPWNLRFAPSDGDPTCEPRPHTAMPGLEKILRFSHDDFDRIFIDSPIKRTKRSGYLRNACVASGNQVNLETIPALAKVLAGEPDAMLRRHAAWALGKINSSAAKQALEKALRMDPDATVIEEIRLAQGSQ